MAAELRENASDAAHPVAALMPSKCKDISSASVSKDVHYNAMPLIAAAPSPPCSAVRPRQGHRLPAADGTLERAAHLVYRLDVHCASCAGQAWFFWLPARVLVWAHRKLTVQEKGRGLRWAGVFVGLSLPTVAMPSSCRGRSNLPSLACHRTTHLSGCKVLVNEELASLM